VQLEYKDKAATALGRWCLVILSTASALGVSELPSTSATRRGFSAVLLLGPVLLLSARVLLLLMTVAGARSVIVAAVTAKLRGCIWWLELLP